jgi:hypothetical protein
VALRLHKRVFVRDAERKQRLAGRHAHIAAKGSIARLRLSRINKTQFMNRNTGIIAAAIPVISLGATQENITGVKDFWVAYSRPEYPILSSMVIE